MKLKEWKDQTKGSVYTTRNDKIHLLLIILIKLLWSNTQLWSLFFIS